MEEIKIFIEKNEYLQSLLDEIGTERFLNAAKEGRSQDFFNGAIFGLSWAGILTSQCREYMIKDKEHKDKEPPNIMGWKD